MTTHSPVSKPDRIQSIDVLRGFALLGILVMNIQIMAMISASYSNPTAYGDLNGANYWVWWISHVFFDQKMMTIFSMLFGAGIALMTEKANSNTGRSVWLHYRRMFWLLLIGLFHAYAIWFGDILVCYAICGMLVYLIRRWNPKLLFVIGLLLISIPSLLNVGFDTLFAYMDSEQIIAEMNADWQPSAEKIEHEVEVYRGSWMDQMELRVPTALFFETFLFVIWSFWRAGGLMLVGIALFRWGVFSAKRSTMFYAACAAIGLAIGIPLVVFGIQQNFLNDWQLPYSQFVGVQYNYWGSLAVSFAYVCVIMLLVKNKWMPGLAQRALSAVGQMALTNYLMHSIMGTFIFYGHGIGYFGSVSRTNQLLIVFAIWLFQIVFSMIWLSRFRFGPAEWLWRSMTYWKMQPMNNPTNSS